MKLRIENLGAVKEATIDLGKKLIVFCGPNGTGKTWTAYAIGGVLDSDLLVKMYYLNKNMSPLISLGEMEVTISPEAILDTLETQLEDFPNRIFSIFPVTSEKQNILFKSFRVSVPLNGIEFVKQYISQAKELHVTILGYSIKVIKEAGGISLHLSCYKEESKAPYIDASISAYLLGGIAYSLATSVPRSAIILPVERNSIFTFNKELSLQKTAFYDTLKQRSNERLFRDAMEYVINSASRYPQAVRDALYVADDITNISRTKSQYYDFGLEIEELLLQGKVSVGEGGEVDFAPKRAKGKSFSFQLSSSAVKTLSSLIIYLKYQAKPNELLIIDEPELNLHPDNQILLARVFARMINKGIRLLISTHSDYIIRELNNLIMLSNKEEPRMQKVAQEFGYHADEYILKEDVGAYLFHFKNERAKHVTVEEIEVADNGFEVTTIEEAIKSLNAASEEIFYTLRHGYQHQDELS